MPATDITFDQVLALATRLRPVDQARLVVRLAPKVEWLIDKVEPATPITAPKPLRGLLSDLGSGPSAADIDDIQREMWASFAQENS